MALYYAASGGNQLLVEALLERGAPVDAPHPDSAGDLSYQAVGFNSPLQAAAERGHVEIVQALLQHKPWIDHRCCDSPSALGMAAAKGHLQIVQLLLDAGADPGIRSSYSRALGAATPLDAARANGHLEVVRVLEGALSARKRK
ncbi:ankyrin repeat domain-containing protein [Solimonas sp. K1W22B-7]|uniref:ankyrin repeat domain-containing protein n=1 Tax=Solimonas sp. K1W22B-7 TaxID=2303331 RepID=UPI0013C4CC18|nr:ankyrin repeat domain-containing protein [Solimonas sp. K1W22B-7]